MPKDYTRVAGRKLVGLIICTLGMVFTACTTLSMAAAAMLDGSFAQNLTITVVGGIGTLYATFCGANVGEHYAKREVRKARVEAGGREEDEEDPPTQP
tara:strand:+ start:548 stop:841 length:294 start_codon:yes stop_codon:yes gene_type:complete